MPSTTAPAPTKIMNKWVLIVDDHESIRQVLIDVFASIAIDVVAVESAAHALVLLEQRRPDLVITDYWMPEMDGGQLIAHLRHTLPEVPVILLTVATVDDKALPADTRTIIMRKPFSVAELLRLSLRSLGIKKASASSAAEFERRQIV